MIKLEDLKIGDKIYKSCPMGTFVYADTIVLHELETIDTYPVPIEGVWCKGGTDIITRKDEEYIFRTEKEAKQKLKAIRLELAKKLLKSNKFIDRLFEYAASNKNLKRCEEYPIYKLAVQLYKEELNKKYNL